ncbi:DUF6049 family protein [Brachybacterium sp. UNK5269]|uniref:DUF6049 family protein n=1 Tax=Brachybacterium sp. UNK5269 TaxID=3408576 RepID=UPI003BB010A0
MPYAQADLLSLRSAGAEQLQGAAQERADRIWEQRDILPRASALPVDGPTADGAILESLLAGGATAAVVPSSSLRADPAAAVTPSSVGVFASTRAAGATLPLLAPDPVLSSEFSLLTGDADAEQTRQRLLAETATIASEFTTAPRHLLIAPSPDATLDAAAAGAALDALAEAPWIESGRTSGLLDLAERQEWTTDPQSGSGEPFALGELEAAEVRPSGPAADGRWEHLALAEDPELLDPEALRELEETWERLEALDAVMEDDAPLDAPRLEILAGTSLRWRGTPEVPVERARDATALTAALQDRIQVVPASGYNVISDVAGVPITIRNDLDTPITVRTQVSSDRPLVRIEEPAAVTVPARGQVDVTVEVEAVANGSVTLTTVVATEDGRPLTAPVEVPLTVNPSWENWTTMVMVIAMGALVVVGVARARRTGAATRAPAVRGPEDPEELARTGRSTLDLRAASPPPARSQPHDTDRPKEDRR